ncbi:acyl-CoA thioesterase [Actinoplanes teichomyceticus]|uniref:Acyl-CoA hydrolase n=1 Tax=Actinoplanes teichomyceticus TaxID=1867 RepID=A0A561VGY1_ACTTI|nr:acyl-CoA thioesterase [Actinoplanes teichomyceticus]TWG10867.1 acyl-CoA hydrolase [Actinoplanes teichomyceticus]GIF12513.1 acyl-CoA thioesterase [Actinoplanes teichomyceticus]
MDEQHRGRPIAHSRVTLSKIMTAVDVNLYGTVHGGVLMKFVDDVAGAAAARHSGGTAVTAAIDEIVFLQPVRVGDLVHAYAQVNWTGRSSMEVGVKLTAEPWDAVGATPIPVATAYLVFVAVDVAGNPRRVPPVLLDDPEDQRRFREAMIRRDHRLARRRAIRKARSEHHRIDD